MPRIFDISVPILIGRLVYAGNPSSEIASQQSMAAGGSSNVSSLHFGSHTGTHVDAPLHMIPGGNGVDRLSLDVLMGPAIVLEFGADVAAVTEALLRGRSLTGQQRVLLKTRNSSFIRSPEFARDYTY